MIVVDNPFVIHQTFHPSGINLRIVNATKEPELFSSEKFDTVDLAEKSTIFDLIRNLKRGQPGEKLFGKPNGGDDTTMPFEFNRSLTAIARISRRASGNLVIGRQAMIDKLISLIYVNVKNATYEVNDHVPNNMLLIAYKDKFDFPIVYETKNKTRYMLHQYLNYFSLLDFE